jgi:TolB-like protein/DNA-binding winged helix-turn-helix (wHTH) protein/Flp pilus assembly protein TadD
MKYRVSDLTIDTGRQVVNRAAEAIPLPKLSYDLLLVLARAAPNVVSVDELMGLVWPGIVVSPETVSQRVKLLRDALDDDPRAPRYIGGLRGRGYQMVATVEEIDADPAVKPATPTDDPPALPPDSRRRRTPLALLIIVVVLVLGWFLAERILISHPHAQGKPAVLSSAPPTVSQSSIAVLPFVDMSEKKDQEYFSDGLSEELIERLGKTQGLRVIARTSSFYFKGRSEKLDAIAKELRVAHVLEGSVRKSGDRLRVTAQLVRADTSELVWSETFDRDLRDVFKVQDEIANAVVSALQIRLLPAEPLGALPEQHTTNIEAYTQYLRGRESYNHGDVSGYQEAVVAYEAATELDAHYAAAYAGLALAEFWLADQSGEVPVYERAMAAAEKAVTLAPELAMGYSARGFLRGIYRFDFAGAQADLDKAVALNPNDATVLHRSAVLLAVFGKLPEAIAREEKALSLDPLSEEICRRLGFFYVANQQLTQARPLYEKALVIAPSSYHARFNLGEMELLEHRPEQALAEFQQTDNDYFRLVGQAKAEFALGHLDAARRALDELIAEYERNKFAEWQIARVYAWRGENDLAFKWAERAYAHRDTGITWIKIETDFRGLRSDARYAALLRKMNLPAL